MHLRECRKYMHQNSKCTSAREKKIGTKDFRSDWKSTWRSPVEKSGHDFPHMRQRRRAERERGKILSPFFFPLFSAARVPFHHRQRPNDALIPPQNRRPKSHENHAYMFHCTKAGQTLIRKAGVYPLSAEPAPRLERRRRATATCVTQHGSGGKEKSDVDSNCRRTAQTLKGCLDQNSKEIGVTVQVV